MLGYDGGEGLLEQSHACVRVCMRVCVSVCARARVWACDVHTGESRNEGPAPQPQTASFRSSQTLFYLFIYKKLGASGFQ